MSVGVQQQLIWCQRELRGERALRQGWEAECRRVLEQNRRLRAELELQANSKDLQMSGDRRAA